MSGFDYKQIKHSFLISETGITYKIIDEGIDIVSNKQSEQVEIKKIHTLECKEKTIKTIGLVIIALGVVLSFLAGYVVNNQSIPSPIIPIPIS